MGKNVCQQVYIKSYRRIWLKFSGKVRFGPVYSWLDFGGNGAATWRKQRKKIDIALVEVCAVPVPL